MRGSCLCGQIGFEVHGGRPTLYQCHCTLCRKQGGSASNSAFLARGSDFVWICGQEGIRSFTRPSGFRSDFCPNCGSPVPNPLRGTPFYWVPAGLIDDDVGGAVDVHLFVGSKASWDSIPADGRRYETAPDLAELIEVLVPGHRATAG